MSLSQHLHTCVIRCSHLFSSPTALPIPSLELVAHLLLVSLLSAFLLETLCYCLYSPTLKGLFLLSHNLFPGFVIYKHEYMNAQTYTHIHRCIIFNLGSARGRKHVFIFLSLVCFA